MAGVVSLVFGGQGAQRVGMGSDFVEAFPVSREVFKRASEVLKLDMQEICFTEDARLDLTEFTQPAILTAEIAILEALKEQYQLAPKYFGGHSLGEYAALVAAEVLSFEDALVIVRKRGQLMQSAVPAGTGEMAAIISENPFGDSFSAELVEHYDVEIANYNSPSQIVVSGKKEKIEKTLLELQKKFQDLRVVPLSVSAPFHCSLMQRIEKEFKEFLRAYEAKLNLERGQSVVSNATGVFHTPESLLDNLISQISRPVRWVENMGVLLKHSSEILEISPSRVLQPFFSTLGAQISSVFNIRSIKKSFLER
ncbi:MAG: ACP S-malonyltransferase [Bdellovibrionales bacterium]|nr:ACP S-malonyltransferase [Bdellovibrionales bacterium]